jgi:pantothenate kinase type III
MDIKESILYADIGNSRIKLFKDGIKTPFHYKHTGFSGNLASHLAGESFLKVVYSSVNRNAENIFLSIARNKKVTDFVNVKELVSEQNIVDLDGVQGMGNDRWLGMLGATAYEEPPVITIDCGTAVTVNVLDYKFKVLGGAIFAGAYTQKNTLATISDKLGFPKFDFNPEGAGTDTASAISLGVVVGVAGGIRMIIENIIEHEHLDEPAIYFTGGYGGKIQRILAKHFPKSIYDENLVFRGMSKLYENVILRR